MRFGISTEGAAKASEEISAAGRRLRYMSSELSSAIDSLKTTENAEDFASEILILEKQHDEIEMSIRQLDSLCAILHRLIDETELTEDVIIEYAGTMHMKHLDAEINDLTSVSDLIGEVIGEND